MISPWINWAVLEFVTVGADYKAFLSGSVKGGGHISWSNRIISAFLSWTDVFLTVERCFPFGGLMFSWVRNNHISVCITGFPFLVRCPARFKRFIRKMKCICIFFDLFNTTWPHYIWSESGTNLCAYLFQRILIFTPILCVKGFINRRCFIYSKAESRTYTLTC